MSSMQALICDEFGPIDTAIRLGEGAAPDAPGPDEVVVEVAYASVSHAMGLMIEGRYQTRPPRPFVPGTEAVGTVVACGANVTRLSPGDRVVAVAKWGCYAERLLLPQHTVYRIPDGLALLDALPVPISYGTAYGGLLWRAAMTPGETVLVLGAGAGVGLAAVELASLLGARVIACASTAAKREHALSCGARHVVEPDEELAARVKQITDGRGADIVVDPVGGPLFEAATRAVAPNGRMLSIGFASGTIPAVPLNILLVKNVTLHAMFFGRYVGWTPRDERVQHADAMQHAVETMLGWARDGKIRPKVSRVYPFAELRQALEALKSRQVVGKVALQIRQQTP